MNAAMMEAMFDKFGKEFLPNQVLFVEHEPGNDFYLIKDGKVKIQKIIGNSYNTIGVLEPGDILGEMAILEEQPRSATAIAVGDVKALVFNRANFEILMTKNPALALKLLNIFSKRIYEAKRHLSILLMDDMQGKVADLFLFLHDKYFPKEQMHEISFNMTITDVANWCASSEQEIQKVLQGLSKSSKIDLLSNKIVIHNILDFQRIVNQKKSSSRSSGG
jgi:CRP/FNR family cyclic AMP-dependent transcriptional regulator